MIDGKNARLARLTPEAVLNMGYMYHVALSPTYDGSPSKTTALDLIKGFDSIDTNGDARGAAFLSQVRAIAVSYGNAVFRASKEHAREMEAARTEYDREEAQLKSARLSSVNLTLAMKLVAIAALALTGFQVAQLISYLVPGMVRAKTGNTLPSLVLGAIFVLVGNYLSTWWKNHQLRKIEVHYNLRALLADRRLENARLAEFRNHWKRALYEWEEYTGETAPSDLPSYLLVLELDTEHRQKWREQEAALNQTDLAAVMSSVMKLLGNLRRSRSA